ncbi:hypothetical protein GCM10007939_14870 [Amylibacter marinus]|uniref:Cupin type-2 domain-containing protein n=2 Tax=Amylibacter marinus TaxID=1475483 RepID=A0ABQ5VVL1_9RHOB|nr:hypothetical protein GCM10007939_14870 [Amylibacter marinus]
MGYHTPTGGLAPQTTPLRRRARFSESYAFIPAECFSDIVTSYLPHWHKSRAWIMARPMSGFAETFAQYIVEVAPNGGSPAPEPDPNAQAGIFVTQGTLTIIYSGQRHQIGVGGYVYIPPEAQWQVENTTTMPVTFHWIRKRYLPVSGIAKPEFFTTSDAQTPAQDMPDCAGLWATTRFVDPDDMRHDMHVNIVSFQQGGCIPFEETHVMEHGLYVLQGRARYLLNQDWIDVEPGDFMWLRAFCPQACVATSTEPFRYLLYKDVNRHPALALA